MRTMTRMQRVLLAVSSIFLMGACASQCNTRTPTITCSSASVTVAPGTCTVITNPCADNRWLNAPRIDGFQLCDAPEGISVRTRGGVQQPTTREICADANVAIAANRPVDYLYSRGLGFGEGIISITTGNPFTLAASATPTTINIGQTSQLLATPTGGVPPYTFAWVPVSTLNQSDIANPVASPTITTIYDVTATDASGATATAHVIVNVASTLVVTASPSTINPGQISQLDAVASGGTPPYSYSWVPVSSLSDPTSSSPVATPANTTTYVVTVTDSAGVMMGDSVTVTVNLVAGATATPDTITAGNSSQLQANVQGGTLPYSYAWSPAASLDDSTSANPVATPSATTTYTVVVTDGAGSTGSADTTVTVTGGGPVACFTYTNNTVSQFINLDASCSTGGVVRYEWDFSFEPGNPDLIRTVPLATWEYGFGASGTITLTVFDAGDASASATLPFP